MSSQLKISLCTKPDESEWDKFLLLQPESCFYQSPIWGHTLTEYLHYGQQTLIARCNGKIVGILPLYLVSNPFLGERLISIPFEASAGGIITQEKMVWNALLEEAIKVGERLKVKCIEIRTLERIPQALRYGFQEHFPLYNASIPVLSKEKNWEHFNVSHRYDVKKARNKGVVITIGSDLKILHDCYKYLLVPHFKRKGTPLFSFGLLDAIWRYSASQNVVLITARFHQQLIGVLLVYCYGTTNVWKLFVSLPKYFNLGTNASLAWAGIEYACEQGFHKIDWGTAERTNTGLIAFKQAIGAEIKNTYSYVYAFRGTPISLETFTENHTKVARKIWQYVPSVITTPLGALIRKWLC